MHDADKRFVYILRSVAAPSRTYVGITRDVVARLAMHNAGVSRYTSHWRPWRLVVSMEFEDEPAAVTFEKYLKSGSGRAFLARHFR